MPAGMSPRLCGRRACDHSILPNLVADEEKRQDDPSSGYDTAE
jgi:hypothetical protein